MGPHIPRSVVEQPVRDDLSITALYTSGTWSWAGFPGAELLESTDAARVFSVTNGVVWLAGWFMTGPSLKHSLVQRHALIDHLTEQSNDIVELAAGLARRGTHRSAEPGVRYVEIDMPHVVAHKEGLLERTEAGRAVLARDNFQRLGHDLTDFDLAPLLGPGTTVIAEGLLMYLDAAAQRTLFGRAVHAGRFVFDLVPPAEQPEPGWVGRLLANLMQRFTGGKGFIADQRTREDIVADLKSAGFDEVQILTPQDAPGFDCPHPDENTQVVVFVATP